MNDKSESHKSYNRAFFPGKIHAITQDDQIISALELLNGELVIGFDTETKPSFTKGEFYHVSLLQLATDDHALLFRLHHLNDFKAIVTLFEDPNIIKTGVAIRDDLKALQKLFAFTPQGFIELADLARERKLKNMGLKGMTEEALNLTLSKKAKLSNWEAKELKADQLQYAATDAWIGRKLYNVFKK